MVWDETERNWTTWNVKYHFIISGYIHEITFANIGESRIWEKEQQKLLGVTIDESLKFKE